LCNDCQVVQATTPTAPAPTSIVHAGDHPTRGDEPPMNSIAIGNARPPTRPIAPHTASVSGDVRRMLLTRSQQDCAVLTQDDTGSVDARNQVGDETASRNLTFGINLKPRHQHEAALMGTWMRQRQHIVIAD